MPKEPTPKGTYVSPRPEGKGTELVLVRNRRAKADTVLSQCDASTLWGFICSVLVNEGCIAITDTSDGGAVSFTIVSGQTRYKCYVAHPSEFRVKLDSLFDAAYGGYVKR